MKENDKKIIYTDLNKNNVLTIVKSKNLYKEEELMYNYDKCINSIRDYLI